MNTWWYTEGYQCAEDNPEVQGKERLILIRDTYTVCCLLRGERRKLDTYREFMRGFVQADKDAKAKETSHV